MADGIVLPYISDRDLRSRLNVSAKTTYRWRIKGLRYAKKGKVILYRLEDIEKFMNKDRI